MTIMVKIIFNNPQPQFQLGHYQFTNNNNQIINAEFVHKSRITADPIFKIDPLTLPTGTQISELKFNGIKPKSFELITPLADHTTNTDYHKNHQILTEFLFELYEIDESKLMTKEGLKEIIRDIKLINLLNGEDDRNTNLE
jgi:hypothetical protein